MTLTTGDMIAGRFRVETLAGTGGMGSVFRARDELTEAEVAVKVLSRQRDADVQRSCVKARSYASCVIRPSWPMSTMGPCPMEGRISRWSG